MASRAGDIRSRAILLSSYGGASGASATATCASARRLARQAIALAEESGDPALYMAVSGGAYAFFCIGEHREGVAICDRAIELADGDPTVGGRDQLRLPVRVVPRLQGAGPGHPGRARGGTAR